jgi:hypothetical protein
MIEYKERSCKYEELNKSKWEQQMFKDEKTFKSTVQNAEIFQAFLFPLVFSSFFFWTGFSNPKVFIYGSMVMGVLCLISVILPTVNRAQDKTPKVLCREPELSIKQK